MIEVFEVEVYSESARVRVGRIAYAIVRVLVRRRGEATSLVAEIPIYETDDIGAQVANLLKMYLKAGRP